MSKPLTFGELFIGDKFICFPTVGDDNGHGGFRGVYHVFEKVISNQEQKLMHIDLIQH